MPKVPPPLDIGEGSLLYIEEAKGAETSGEKGRGQAAPETASTAFRFIGKPTARVDGRKIVTGEARFTHDIKLRGLLTGKILRSPHASAEVVSIDLSPALALAGVLAGLKLAEGRVRYAGEQVAAVAAVDEATAEKALALIKVDYRPLPFIVEWEKAKDTGAPQVRDGKPNVEKFNDTARGDVEKGFAEADVVLERVYGTGIEIHHPTETHGSLAVWDEDQLTVYDSSQNVHGVRDGLARTLKIPAADVTVITNYMGGGFGSKLGLNDYTVAAARLAREAGRPVKIILSRRDNAMCVGYRPSTRQRYKAGVKKDGTLTALSVVNETSGGLTYGDEVAEPLIDLYRCPNCKVEEYSLFNNTCPGRATRAPGHTQAMFGLEGLMDELAAAIGMDPLALRLKNYTTKNRGDTGLPYSTKGLDKCYAAGAKAIGWERRNKIPGGGTGRVRRGIGMSSSLWWGGGVPGTLADIVLYPDGSVEAVCGTQDIGTGTRTHVAVVAADTLGLEPGDITVRIGDTAYPWAPGSGGSQTTPSVAPAVRDAALKAVERLKQIAAQKLEAKPEDLVMTGRAFAVKGPSGKAIPFADVYRALRRETVFHGERGGYPGGEFAFNTFAAHFAEVEVDLATGRIRVLRYAAAHDSGQIINTATAESQVIGAVTQGLSAGLFEERIMDSATGNPVNADFENYKIATALDIPEITTIFVDVTDPRLNNLGTKGLGEPPRIPSSAAIANAVYNAVGVHVGELPMTPDRVLAALRRKEAGR
jgi:xanthine dehydrogenase YagR molybdenum-binding subunit